MNIVKGTRIEARWFQANNPPSSLAGMQMKLGVTERVVVGTVTHIRGDRPTNPTKTLLLVKPDDSEEEVQVDPKHVISVL